MQEEMLTTAEVAERYKIDEQTQQLYRSRYKLPFTKIGKRIRYRKVELENFIEKHTFNKQGDADDGKRA